MATLEISTDAFSNTCITEEVLDRPETWSKFSDLPQTCLPSDAPRTPEVLAWALGRDPTPAEWSTFSYRWFRTNEPDRVLFTDPGPLPVPPVPLDGAGAFLFTALALVWLLKAVTERRAG